MSDPAVYRLHLAGPEGLRRVALYTPATSRLVWETDGAPLLDVSPQGFGIAFPVSPGNPAGKDRTPRVLKIQLGLKCNYSCQYCSQAHQPHDGQGNPDEAEAFLARLPHWLDGSRLKRIEFWGGEPFAYWKTLQPLAEALRARFPQASFNIVSNGSLLDAGKIAWLDRLGFGIGISHDGPAMTYRGPDPLRNPAQRAQLRALYDRLAPKGRISFNAVLHRKNASLAAVRDYIAAHLGVPAATLPVCTEEILLPYDAGGMRLSLRSESERRGYTDAVFWEAVRGHSLSVSTMRQKIDGFLKSLGTARPAASLGQKCGMDDPGILAVDLKGNALTCQNTSAATRHRIGHLDDPATIRLDTAHHWSTRAECGHCPVLQLCQGACLFLEGELWAQACDNSYAHNTAVLAAALYWLTRLVLVAIEGPPRRDGLPALVPMIDPPPEEAQHAR